MLMTATTMSSSMRVKPPWPTGRRWLRFTSFIAKPPFGSTGTYRRRGGRPSKAERRCTKGADSARARAWLPFTPSGVVQRRRGPKINAERSLPGHDRGHRPPVGVCSRHRGDVGLSTYRQPIIPPSARATLLSHAARARDPAIVAPHRARAAPGSGLGLAHTDRPHGEDGASPGATAARVWPRRPGGSPAAHAGGQAGEDPPRVAHEDESLQSGERGAPARPLLVEGDERLSSLQAKGTRGGAAAPANRVRLRRAASAVATRARSLRLP